MAAGSTAEEKFLRGSALEEKAPTTTFERWFVVRKTLVARLKIEPIIRRVQPCCDFFSEFRLYSSRPLYEGKLELRIQHKVSEQRIEKGMTCHLYSKYPGTQRRAFVTRYQRKRTFHSAELTVSTALRGTRLRLHHSRERPLSIAQKPLQAASNADPFSDQPASLLLRLHRTST
jgi:hypothetical protein